MYMKKLLLFSLLALGGLTLSCSDDDYYYEHAEDGRPEYAYLTTIPAEQFDYQAVGYGWRRTDTRIINEEGYADEYEYHYASGLFPSHYYFSEDSVTQFTYTATDSIRRRFTYTYDERTNMLNSSEWKFMQLSKLTPLKMWMVEKFYEDDRHVFFIEATYERILPFDMYDYWNNFKPIEQ